MEEMEFFNSFKSWASGLQQQLEVGVDQLDPDFSLENFTKVLQVDTPTISNKVPIMKNLHPYTAVYIDATISDLVDAGKCCLKKEDGSQRTQAVAQLQKLFTTTQNPNLCLPCLSVRTIFDLFLSVVNFPMGSELIMSAINIPSMAQIAEHHGLRIVPLDVDTRTLSPRAEDLELLLTERTVAIVVSHLYGSVIDVTPFVDFSLRNHLYLIEDCAQAFDGFRYLGHPSSDLSMFSFGVIKYRTAFGGAVAKIRKTELYRAMLDKYESYPSQTGTEYLRKLAKYAVIYYMLNVPSFVGLVMKTCKMVHVDYRAVVVSWMRSFPASPAASVRLRPSTALLTTMAKRLSTMGEDYFTESVAKASYARRRLPSESVIVGSAVQGSTCWLFPILVKDPTTFTKIVNDLGVDAYRGATQLDVILPKSEDLNLKVLGNREKSSELPDTVIFGSDDLAEFEDHGHNFGVWFPYKAKCLIDHVVYLPIHKNVPYKTIDSICESVTCALTMKPFTSKL